MARIPNEEIERLKRDISVVRLAEAHGVQLKRHGANLVGLCPFHDDKTPSLVITPEKNLWHCLGACQAGGSSIDWVMKAHGVSFRYAVELLRADVPAAIDTAPAPRRGRQQGPVAKHSTTTKLPLLADRTADDEALMRHVVDYYHATLKDSPDALAYLQRRGIGSAEMIEHFRVGFANRTLGYRLPGKTRAAGAELRGQLQKLGVLRESGHEHFNGSIVIPIFDAQSRVAEMYGRKITEGLREGTPLHLYLPGPHRGVFNLEALAASKEIILCEALIDALTFWCAGFRNVTASYGIEGFTDEHMEALRAHGTARVYIAYDRDAAGDGAAEKLAVKLTAAGIECFRVMFPKGMDANEYARKMTPSSQSLGLVLRQAQWMALRPSGLARRAQDEPETGTGTAATTTAALESSTSSERATGDDAPRASESHDSIAHALIEAAQRAAMPAAVTTSAATVVPADVTSETPPEPSLPLAAESEQLPSPPSRPPSIADTPDPAPAAVHPEQVVRGPSTTMPNGPQITRDDLTFRFGDRTWRVRGFGKNAAPEVLRINVLCMRDAGGFHVDTMELYSARQRAQYATLAAAQLAVEEPVIHKDLGQLLLALETLQAKAQSSKDPTQPDRRTLTQPERDAALALLRDPRLLDRILEDFDRCGTVGERTNKLVGYLAATSRLLDQPLAIVIQSSSAAGKSSLMDAVLALMPEEERVQYSAMTGQSLFYLGETDLRHKILAIVEEQGAERASYALKLLQSEGELTIASTSKDPATGRMVTQQYRVEGPVMIFLTTTAIDVDDELLNRCIVFTVDEGREQTRAIHARQRAAQTLEGILARTERDHVVKVHRDAQRLLRPLLVVNPFAEKLSFLDHATRMRRDHTKYLTLIRTIALLHQHQRPIRVTEHRGKRLEYIEATREDIAMANGLCHEVLGRSLDELPPQTRRLLGHLDQMVREACARTGVDRADHRFTRREVREATRWCNTQVHVHLERLLEMEYLVAYRGKQGQSYAYALCYDSKGHDGAPFLPGLLDVNALAEPVASASTTQTLRGSQGQFSGGIRPPFGPFSGGVRAAERSTSPGESGCERDVASASAETTRLGTERANGSYANVSTLTPAQRAH